MKISKYRMLKRNIARLEREIAELKEVMESKGMSVAGYQGVCLGGASDNGEPDYYGEYHMLNVFLRSEKAELQKIRLNPFSRIPKYNFHDFE